MECFVHLVELDEERRLIHGRTVPEAPDRSQGSLDYDSAKLAFRDWSKACEDATGGRSKGNVRAMHGTLVAGKVVDLAFSDAEKAIDIVVKVVDDNEWRKCAEGCYTGFSVGGSDARTWPDGAYTHYTPTVTELSLVDRPCIPTARFFSLHKADGRVEKRAFSHAEDRQRQALNKPVASQSGNDLDVAHAKPLLFADLYKKPPSKPLMFNDLYQPRSRKDHCGRDDAAHLLLHKVWSEAQHPRNEKGEFVAFLARAAAEGAWEGLRAMVGMRLQTAGESMAGPDGEGKDGNQAPSEPEAPRAARPRGPVQTDSLPGPEPSPYPLGWPVIDPTYWKRNPRIEWGA